MLKLRRPPCSEVSGRPEGCMSLQDICSRGEGNAVAWGGSRALAANVANRLFGVSGGGNGAWSEEVGVGFVVDRLVVRGNS